MTPAVYLLVGFAVGALAAWQLAVRRARALMNGAFETLPEIPRSLLESGLSPEGRNFNSLADLGAFVCSRHTEISEALRRAKIFSDNLVAAIVLRNAEAKIVYCSPYTEVLTGYSIQEIKGCAGDFFESVMHADDREQYRRALKICASGEAFQYRYRLTHRTGIEIWVETRTVPILNQDGRVESYLSVTLDVTGNVRYQKQVEEKNRDLQDFTYMVSHDLKAPIFTIKGMLGIIRDDFGKSLSPDFQEVLGHIERGILRLEQLVSRVLEYSRISTQDGKAEPVDLSHTLAEVAKDFSTQLAEAKGTLTIPPNLPSVSGDPLQIYRVFANLIGNAIKYRSPDRAVAISISYELTRDGRYVRISVVDNGQGIPADKIESVFRPFHRLHGASVEGTGIGLATVKKIVERSGGSIELKSAEDAGSTFIVSLKKHAHEESARNIASR